jgi:fermentation-respiration switch protein FrsA (DUF1100 family)
VFLVAGSRDRLTPPSDSLALKALTRAPVEMVVVEGAGHVNIHQFPAYLDALADRLVRVGGG